ncbi:hypothetical protein Tco_0837993 [Tanacetum coccineum]
MKLAYKQGRSLHVSFGVIPSELWLLTPLVELCKKHDPIIILTDSGVPLSSAALVVLTTRPPCQPSLASCLSSLRESLPSVPDAYGQSLEALLSQPAVFRSESYVPGAMSKEEYPVTIVVSDEHGTKSRVHIPAYDGSEALKKHVILLSKPRTRERCGL